MSRLKEKYTNEIVDAMTKKFGYKNIMEVPKLDKIVINMGVGEAKDNAKALESAVKALEGYGDHYRTESSSDQSKELCCELQDQRGYGNRLQGYTSWRENVRVC